jgi:hypothetical protein
VWQATISGTHIVTVESQQNSSWLVLRDLTRSDVQSRRPYVPDSSSVIALAPGGMIEIDASGIGRVFDVENARGPREVALCGGPGDCSAGERCAFEVRTVNDYAVVGRRCYGDRGYREWWMLDVANGRVRWTSRERDILAAAPFSGAVLTATTGGIERRGRL